MPTKNLWGDLPVADKIRTPFSLAREQATFLDEKTEIIVDKVFVDSIKYYQRKSEAMAQSAMPIIKNVYENESGRYKNIVVPITDGIKTIQVVANLEECVESDGKELIKSFEKNVILAMIDNSWKDHLREMDDLPLAKDAAAEFVRIPAKDELDEANWQAALQLGYKPVVSGPLVDFHVGMVMADDISMVLQLRDVRRPDHCR